MLADEDHQEEQGERKNLLHPPCSMLNIIPLVRRIPPIAATLAAGPRVAVSNPIPVPNPGVSGARIGHNGHTLIVRKPHNQTTPTRRRRLLLPVTMIIAIIVFGRTNDPDR